MNTIKDNMKIKKLCEYPEDIERVSIWFADKWKIPKEEYKQSMKVSVAHPNGIPQWYVIEADGNIIGGAGIIENDFHENKKATPNICALYIEKEYRNKGYAGHLLEYMMKELICMKISTIYLVSDLQGFYEHYGFWKIGLVKDQFNGMITLYARHLNK